jgi:hypothetical protein
MCAFLLGDAQHFWDSLADVAWIRCSKYLYVEQLKPGERVDRKRLASMPGSAEAGRKHVTKRERCRHGRGDV